MATATLGDLNAVDQDVDAHRLNGARHGASDDTDGEPPQPPTWTPLVIPAPVEWFTEQPPARTWLLRDSRRPKGNGLLPLGRVGQIIGEGGASKTMAAMQLAVSVATGVPWLATFTVATKGRVLLIVGEEDAEEVRRRLYRVRASMGAPIPEPDTIVVLPLAGVPCAMLERDACKNMVEAPFLPWLRGWLREHGPWSLVIVDPLSRFAGPDAEIDNAAATRFVQALESIATETRATVLVTHHTNKLARQGGAVQAAAGRGSSALVDGVRWQCSLGVERLAHETPEVQERLGELVTWSHTKSNYSKRADDLLLRRDPDNGGALMPLGIDEHVRVESARARMSTRGQNKAKKDAANDARDTAEDGAVDRAVAARPGIPTRDLVTAVQAAARCGRDRATVAVARAADRLDVRDGPRSARLHFPRAT